MSIFFFNLDLYVSISIIWHAALFFRSYSGNLPAMFFNLFFSGNGLPNSIIVRSTSSSCLVSKNSLNCTSGLVLPFFSSSDALFSFYNCSHSKAEKSNHVNDFLFSLSAFARVTSFLTLSS